MKSSTLADNATAMTDTAVEAADSAIRSSQRVATQAIERVADRVDGMREQTQKLAQRGIDAVRDGSQQVRQRALQTADTTKAYVKDEPMKSILIAAAIGAGLMALISLLGRSSRD